MANEFKIISEDGLKTLCKAIKKTSTVGEIIDDDNSVTDKTYSSFKIDGRLNAKIDKTQLTTVLDENVTDEQIPGARVVVDELGLKANDSEVVKKTDIATTINSTSTDREVPSAKAVYNTTSKFLKTYTSIEQLGLTSGSETIENIVNSMESHTRLITVIELPNKYIYPGNCGTLIVEKLNIYRVHFKFCMDGSPTVFVGTYHAVTGFTGWQRLCTTTVADVKETSIEFDETALGLPIWNNRSKYKVINGICYVTVELNVDAHNTDMSYGYKKVNTTSLPKIGFSTKGILNAYDGNSGITAVLDKETTDLKLHGVTRAKEGSYTIQGSFSYPVAE